MDMEGNELKDKKVIAFQIEDEEYAFFVDQVNSIERMMPITRVPHTAEFIMGVINLRGVVLPIIDLRIRLGLEKAAYDKQTRIIIVQTDEMEVGLIVDAANDVISISDDDIEDAPNAFDTEKEDYIDGVLKLDGRLLVLLNLQKILMDPKEIQTEVNQMDFNREKDQEEQQMLTNQDM